MPDIRHRLSGGTTWTTVTGVTLPYAITGYSADDTVEVQTQEWSASKSITILTTVTTVTTVTSAASGQITVANFASPPPASTVTSPAAGQINVQFG